ncbi:hypothetical protein KCMC57_up13750 [Kitasatospora sp. CMC57]|uniref:Uncharacterized protein n=1 Tax=Kitasatospora sp. CMC57 TaxID=3231513 RepID=A0AB33JQA8_9ACTN
MEVAAGLPSEPQAVSSRPATVAGTVSNAVRRRVRMGGLPQGVGWTFAPISTEPTGGALNDAPKFSRAGLPYTGQAATQRLRRSRELAAEPHLGHRDRTYDRWL